MKNLIKVFMLLVLTISFNSCESIKGVFDVEFESTFSGDLDIDIPGSALKAVAGIPFEASANINPREIDDVEKYHNKIEQVRVDEIKPYVETVEGGGTEDVVFLAGTTFKVKNNDHNVEWSLAEDWTITPGTGLRINNDDIKNEVAKVLTSMQEFSVGIKGECNQSGVYILIRVDLETTITANPL